jgi:hypothetical protein
MKKFLFSLRSLTLGGIIAAVAAVPAHAATFTPVVTSLCPIPVLSQPFLSVGDLHWYTLAPGQTADNFAGTGWVLTGGAKIVTETLADGRTGSVLDLPAGSTATSPSMCVDSTYPLARMETRTLGAAPDTSTAFYTVPVGGHALTGMPVFGATHWGASNPANVVSAATSAEQVQFKFVAGTKAADLQVYNVYIDPNARY